LDLKLLPFHQCRENNLLAECCSLNAGNQLKSIINHAIRQRFDSDGGAGRFADKIPPVHLAEISAGSHVQ
jgi:hypothetical protein